MVAAYFESVDAAAVLGAAAAAVGAGSGMGLGSWED